MKSTTILAWVILVIVVVALALFALDAASPSTYQAITGGIFPTASTTANNGSNGNGTTGGTQTGVSTFYCDQGQIDATFSTNAVQLRLSDSRYFSLPQVQSGSGIRYEATIQGKDELFQSKGDSASLTENDKAIYANCVAAHVSDAGDGRKTYLDQNGTFTFSYPNAFNIVGTEPGYTQSWMVNATTSGMILAQVSLPAATQPKTNFSGATFTVGTSADPAAVASCLTYNPSGGPAVAATSVNINGVTFTKFTSSDAGAGNLYNTVSYRAVRNNQCYALEYTIHSTQLANYPASAGIKAFDSATITSQLGGIAASFKFVK